MRDCPACGTPVDGSSCARCGWGDRSGADPSHLICEHLRQGQRCAEYGTISPNPRGGAPWYCRQHYDEVVGRSLLGKPSPPPEGFAPLKALVAKAAPLQERQPGEDDA